MNNSSEIKQQMDQAVQDLVETTFGEVVVGRSYLTPAGHRVEVIEVVPHSHAIVVTTKGREMRIPADKICRGPLPILVDEAEAHADKQIIATKRRPKVTIDNLRAEYLRTTGRESRSSNRRYLMWRLSPAGLRRSPVGPVQHRPGRQAADVQVLPVGILRSTVAKHDTASREMGFKSRSALIRAALIALLRNGTSDAARLAADAIEAEARA